jgi:hypothetical protein
MTRSRFKGVRPGWEAFLWVPGGFTESLGVWGFEVDAAIARNYQARPLGRRRTLRTKTPLQQIQLDPRRGKLA